MKEITNLIENIEKNKAILSAFIYGSQAKNLSSPLSDIDICLMIFPKKYTNIELSMIRLSFIKQFPNLDIRIFQQLPLYIRKRILKDGIIIFCRDEDSLYNESFRFITEYSDYEHILKEYLKENAYA